MPFPFGRGRLLLQLDVIVSARSSRSIQECYLRLRGLLPQIDWVLAAMVTVTASGGGEPSDPWQSKIRASGARQIKQLLHIHVACKPRSHGSLGHNIYGQMLRTYATTCERLQAHTPYAACHAHRIVSPSCHKSHPCMITGRNAPACHMSPACRRMSRSTCHGHAGIKFPLPSSGRNAYRT